MSTVTNALGQVRQITAVNGLGQPLSVVDPNGLETDFAYDSVGRVKQVTVNPGSAPQVTSIGYDAVGDVTSIVRPSGASYLYQYDAARRLSSITDAFGNQIHYTRNVMGGITAIRVTDVNGNLVQASSATFDELNRLLSSIGANGEATGYTYDRTDNQTSRTDPLNNQYSFAFDALNRLISESGPLQYSVSYGYDGLNHLNSITDPRGLVTQYVYDGFGDLIGLVSPDTGMTVKTYDQAGNVISSTDANGHTTRYSYDALKRLTQLSRADGSSATYTRDQNDAAHGAGIGRMTHAQDTESNTSLDWQYDIYGHILQKAENVGGYSYITAYTYSSGTGNLQSMTLPSGAVVGYSWTNGKVVSLTLNNAALVSNITYQPFGGPNAWTLANHEVTGRSVDLDGRIVTDPLGSITYDSSSRVVQWSPGGESVLSGIRGYGYDALNRLTSYADPNNNIAYTYDASGNRTSQTVNGAQTNYVIDPASNRLLGASAGNSTNTVTAATYAYDPMGVRAARTNGIDTRYFAYDENHHLIGEYSPTAGAIQETIYLGDMPVAIVAGGNSYFVHADYRNAPLQIDNAAGNAVWDWDPLAFGDNAENDNPLGLSDGFSYAPRFPGQYYDSESGQFYNMARSYEPKTGRYSQSDPIGMGGGINTYAYVRSNPISLTDPLGLLDEPTNPGNTGQTGGGERGSFGPQNNPNFPGRPNPPKWPIPYKPSPDVCALGPTGSCSSLAYSVCCKNTFKDGDELVQCNAECGTYLPDGGPGPQCVPDSPKKPEPDPQSYLPPSPGSPQNCPA